MMKKFLYKISIYLFITVLVVCCLIAGYYVKRKPAYLSFVSNSMSHNLKAGFIVTHPQLYKNARVVIIGSSMSLNNIDGMMLRDSLKVPVINTASWGMNVASFEKFDIWDSNRLILYNIHFNDLVMQRVKEKAGFPASDNGWTQGYNIFFDRQTYVSDLANAALSRNEQASYGYYTCNFDSTGSVMLKDSAFAVDSGRWKNDVFTSFKIDAEKIATFAKQVSDLNLKLKDKKFRLVISFSPGRHIFYSPVKLASVQNLQRLITKDNPGIIFINKYNTNYSDSCFTDEGHFNARGAKQYTRELIDSLRAKQLL